MFYVWFIPLLLVALVVVVALFLRIFKPRPESISTQSRYDTEISREEDAGTTEKEGIERQEIRDQ